MHFAKSLQTFTDRTFLKLVFVLFTIIMALVPEVYAEDSWYSIDDKNILSCRNSENLAITVNNKTSTRRSKIKRLFTLV